MRRNNAIAAVYRFTEKSTGKIYIGETQDINVRYNDYNRLSTRAEELKSKNKKYIIGYRPIEVAICENGIDSFDFEVLITEKDDIDLLDPKYRKAMETYYIKKSHSDDPKYGFNRPGRYKTFFDMYRTRKISFHNLHKAYPVLLYDLDDDSMTMFLSTSSCAAYINSDKGNVGKAIKYGKKINHYLFYYINTELRLNSAAEAIARKVGATGSTRMKSQTGYDLAKRYIHGLIRSNEWSEQWGYDGVSFDKLRGILNVKYNVSDEVMDYIFTSQ